MQVTLLLVCLPPSPSDLPRDTVTPPPGVVHPLAQLDLPLLVLPLQTSHRIRLKVYCSLEEGERAFCYHVGSPSHSGR